MSNMYTFKSIFTLVAPQQFFLLDRAGFDIKKLEKGLSPYAAAKQFISIDENDEVRLLAQMKEDYPWDLIQAIAEDHYKKTQ